MDDSDLQPYDDVNEETALDDEDLDVTADELDEDGDEESDEDFDPDEDEGDDPDEDGDPEDLEADEHADEDDLDADEAEHATVASAATVETAKRLALEGMRKIVPVVDEADVEFVVLEEGSKGGFFGRGRVEAQVEARLRPSAASAVVSDEGPPPGAETLRAFVQEVVDRMGVEASVSAHETPDAIHADISGDDLGILIGRHGTTIDALQYLAAIAVNGDRRHRRQVVVDAEGYRTRREASLKALADRSAQKAVRESGSVQLKPMTAAERKVIHLHLKDHPRVETVSEGQEPFRAVVITPRPRRG